MWKLFCMILIDMTKPLIWYFIILKYIFFLLFRFFANCLTA